MRKTLIAALLSTGLAMSPMAVSASPEFGHIETVGVGEVAVVPDMAVINVEVVLTKSTAKQAKAASDKAITDFIARMNKMGVKREDIESANIHLSPQYRYQENKEPVLTGYRASRNVMVTVHDLEQVNPVLDGALDKGLNRINGIELKASNEDELIKQARLAAIKDAKEKATILAEGFDEEIEGVWKVRYHDFTPIRPVMMRAMEAKANVGASYQDTEITIRDRVEVIFELKD